MYIHIKSKVIVLAVSFSLVVTGDARRGSETYASTGVGSQEMKVNLIPKADRYTANH